MKRAAGGLLVVALVLGAGSARVEEDSPWWDCSTMGNRVCGVPHE